VAIDRGLLLWTCELFSLLVPALPVGVSKKRAGSTNCPINLRSDTCVESLDRKLHQPGSGEHWVA